MTPVDAGHPFRITERESLYQGYVIGLERVTMTDEAGDEHQRDVVTHPGAVAVVAITDDRRVVLVRQYRVAIDDLLLEIPAGKRDVADEPPVETARRELAEEAGYTAEHWEPLARLVNSPGFCDEVGHIFLATGLADVPLDRQGAEEEAMTIELVPLDEVVDLIADGAITDAKTQVGLLMALQRVGRR